MRSPKIVVLNIFTIALFFAAFSVTVLDRANAAPMFVKHTVPPTAQGNADLCWAAVTTMLLNWKNPVPHTMQSMAKLAGPNYESLQSQGKAISGPEEIELYKILSLKTLNQQNPTLEKWYKLLSEEGPLSVTILTNNSGGMLHAILMVGLSGNGTANGTMVTYIEPNGGVEKQVSFLDFVKLFEAAAGYPLNIVHR